MIELVGPQYIVSFFLLVLEDLAGLPTELGVPSTIDGSRNLEAWSFASSGSFIALLLSAF